MTDFNLKIIPASEKAVIFGQSDFGEATTEIEKSFLDEVAKESSELRDFFNQSRLKHEFLSEKHNEFGLKLFRGIFKEKVLDLFNRTIGGSIVGKVHIRLMLGNIDLNTIQWELMRYRNEFIAFRHELVRHPFISRPATSPQNKNRKLHVLAVAVDPIYGEETVKEEHRNLCDMLNGFGDKIKLTPLYQEEASLERIIDVLFEGVDIWHFCGHGAFDRHNPMDSYLVVWGKGEDKFDKLSIRTIRTLAMSNSLGFSFLNACDTGRIEVDDFNNQSRNTTEQFVSMAHSLIEVGVPMVIATNHLISVAAATKFSRRFYSSVIKFGRRVDEAVREGRAELYIGGSDILPSDWSCPALYARASYFGLGMEKLEWRESLDLYQLRNVEKPKLVRVNER